MLSTNCQAAATYSFPLNAPQPSIWRRFLQFLLRRRVRITAVLLTALIVEDVLEGTQPRSLFDFKSFYSMLGVALVFGGVALRSWAAGTLHKNTQLTNTGAYGFIRHPLYVGSFLAMLGICTLINDEENIWFVAGPVLALYVHRTLFEERHLAKKFGTLWDEYTRQVPRYFPRRWPQDAFGSWCWKQWTDNREYRFAFSMLLGLAALQWWHAT